MIGLAWGAGTEGQDGKVQMVQRDGKSVERNVSSVGSLPERMQSLDAPIASPAEIPTPGVLVQEPAEAEAEGRASSDKHNAGRPSDDVTITGRREDTLTHNFLAGYFAGGGDPAWEQRVLSMIECESGWQLDPPGIHLGLAQFAPATWETVAGISGLWDYTNPYHVGYNVAVWMGMIAPDYGSSQGWPNCW